VAGEESIERRMQKIWLMACELDNEMNQLDDLAGNKSVQFAAIQSCQSQYRDWRGYNLGELMNLFGIPPEKRAVSIRKGALVDERI